MQPDTVLLDRVLYGAEFDFHGDSFKAHFPGERIPREEFERLTALGINGGAKAKTTPPEPSQEVEEAAPLPTKDELPARAKSVGLAASPNTKVAKPQRGRGRTKTGKP